jgi:hypothetical protein
LKNAVINHVRTAMALLAMAVLFPSVGATQPTPVVLAECATSAGRDTDRDGLPDICEARVARVFAPILVARGGGCNWNADARMLAGGYFFAVAPVQKTIRVAYLPAYFRDCGWEGVKCWLPTVDCAPHAGDSEFIVIELQPEATSLPLWSVAAVFLSAHCFGDHGEHCRWYRDRELRAFDWSDTAPVIWVAEGRHANFPSRTSCDRGLHFLDTCDAHDARFRFPIADARNIGSRAHPPRPGGCVTGAELRAPGAASETIECFWRFDTPFRGWQLGAAGVTPYARYLTEIGGF